MRKRLVAAFSSLLLTAGVLAGFTLVTASPAQAFTAFQVPTGNAGLDRIVTAPNGDMWFVEQDAHQIGRITPAGQITEYPAPGRTTDSSQVIDLDVAPDGTVWVTVGSGRTIAQFNPATGGWLTGSLGAYPYGGKVRVDPAGTVWTTMKFDDRGIASVKNGGLDVRFEDPECDDVLGIGTGGSVWCARDKALVNVGATSGGTTYPLPDELPSPYSLAAGPTGSIWYSRYYGGSWFITPDEGHVGYVTAGSSQQVEFNTGDATAPTDLVMGPDGAMWYASVGRAKAIGHVTAAGTGALTQVGNYQPTSLTFAKDGWIWFTDSENNSIVRVSPDELRTTNVDPGEGSIYKVGQTVGAGGGVTGRVVAAAPRGGALARGNKVAVPLQCKKGEDCTGQLALVTAKKVKVPKGAETMRAKAKKARVVLGTASYTVKAGKKKSVKVKLSKAGKKLVKKKPLAVRVVVSGKTVGSLKVRR
jgi:virginiamycin B lyase